MTDAVLEARGISKRFPGVLALDGVDLQLRPGTVHALVGENGAGKSTLIKILGGQQAPTSGAILVDGHETHLDDPLQSQRAGISVINQEFSLIPQLTIAANIFLGRELRRAGGIMDWRETNARAARLLRELGLETRPEQRVEYLSVADKQLVEVAKALSQEARVMIMDEPTAALNGAEVERLFGIVEDLRARGTAVLYVSHRLSEIFRIADVVTVLRDGRHVATQPVSELTEHRIITMMLGRELETLEVQRSTPPEGTPALAVHDLTTKAGLGPLSFELRYGEVLGVAGLVGSGRSELMRTLFGLTRRDGGSIRLDGRPIELHDAGQALRSGIFMLPEDRKVEGIYPDLDVLENLVIMRARDGEPAVRRAFIDASAERDAWDRLQTLFEVRAHSSSQLVSTLSGGNQQKVVLGRALVSKARILLLNEPTRGVDVGTKLEIHELIRGLAADGHAIMVSSSDVPELDRVSDRCIVLSAGHLAATLEGPSLSEDGILACAVAQGAVVPPASVVSQA